MSDLLLVSILILFVMGFLSTTASSEPEKEETEKEPTICKECGSEIFDKKAGRNQKLYFQMMAIGTPHQMKTLREIIAPAAKA